MKRRQCGGRDRREREKRERSAERGGSTGRHDSVREDQEREEGTRGAKQERGWPTFWDGQEMSVIDFVKGDPENAMLTRPEKTPCGTPLVKS